MTLSPVVANIVRGVAPLVAGALAGPFAPVAAMVVAKAVDAWLGPDERAAAASASPEAVPAVTQAIQRNISDPDFIAAMQRAQDDLQRYQIKAKVRFAEIEQKDRSDARTMVRDTGLARPQFIAGMSVVCLSMLMMGGIVIGCMMAMSGALTIAPANVSLTVAAFGLLGTVTGAFQGVALQILAFYFGSSAASSRKSDQISDAMTQMGRDLGDAAKAAPPTALPAPAPVVVVPAQPAQPAPEPDADVTWDQSPFGGVRWRFDEDGYVVVEGEDKPGRTVGEPVTVRRIWRDYGSFIKKHCAVHGVPLELVVACIGTESRGQVSASLTEPDGRRSLGLMQVLTGTASEVMGREVAPAELLSPDVGIEAGVRYLAKQRAVTSYSPPRSAAAFNAGGLYPMRPQDDNRWHLRSTGDHIDRFVLYFNDSVFVAKSEGWTH